MKKIENNNDNLDFVARYWQKDAFNVDKAMSHGGFGMRRRILTIMTAAAAAVVIILFGSLWARYIYNSPDSSTTELLASAKQIYGLPDGTMVTLWPGSSLTYDTESFSSDRKVSLTGKGRFDVARDPSHPFRVTADSYSITVLGTIFTADAADKKISVDVERGKVKVADSERSAILTAGMSLYADAGVFNVSQPSPQVAEFSFDNMEMGEIVAAIEKKFDIRIKGDYDPNHKLTLRLSGTAEDILSDLNIVAGTDLELIKTNK